jgi:excisionase family DNA binding protein
MIGHEAAVRAAVDALVAVILTAVTEAVPAGTPDRLLSVDEAAAALGIGRSRLYDEIAAQRVRSVKVGRRRLVPSGAIADYIAAARP